MILHIWFFLFAIRNKTANSCKCVFQKNPSWNCIILTLSDLNFLLDQNDFSKIVLFEHSWQCYVSFRSTTSWLDKSICYAMPTTGVSTICHHITTTIIPLIIFPVAVPFIPVTYSDPRDLNPSMSGTTSHTYQVASAIWWCTWRTRQSRSSTWSHRPGYIPSSRSFYSNY